MRDDQLPEIPKLMSGLILIRHAAVAERYTGVCFGQSDVELSVSGEQQSLALARTWPTSIATPHVVHSGFQRASFLALVLADHCGVTPEVCPALAERDFGDWELQTWDNIYSATQSAMDRMLTEPATFRPGGGETTYELRDRVAAWYASLDPDVLTIGVTHGGPIAALLGVLQSRPVSDWPSLVPPCGTSVVIRSPHPQNSKLLSHR